MDAPTIDIDPIAFRADPYPDLARLRAEAPVAIVPQLGGAVLLTKRADIHREEKRIEVLSSRQPDGLMTRLMGENLMRRDGDAHLSERRALFPALSPRTVTETWAPLFRQKTAAILDALAPRGEADLVRDYAMPVSAEALKLITGLTNMAAPEMDRVSQGMIDGCANYGGDPEIEAHCHDCTASIDRHIDAMLPRLRAEPNLSAISVMDRAGLPPGPHLGQHQAHHLRRPERAARRHRGRRLGGPDPPGGPRQSATAPFPGTPSSPNTPAGSAPSACPRARSRAPIPSRASTSPQAPASSSCSAPPTATRTGSTPPTRSTPGATRARPSPSARARISARAPRLPARSSPMWRCRCSSNDFPENLHPHR
jgi:hypothetical protein